MFWLPGGVALAAADRVPIADFARPSLMERAQLSPDGKSIGFIAEFNGRRHICITQIGRPETVRFQIGQAEAFGTIVNKEVSAFQWISNERLAVITTVWDALFGVAAMNRDGRAWTGLSGRELDPKGRTNLLAYEIIHRFDDQNQSVLMLDRRDSLGSARLFPHVLRVNGLTGGSRVVAKNPGNVVSWMPDNEGGIRVGIARDEDKSSVLYRESEDAAWRTLPLPDRGREKLRALGFDPISGTFYVAGLTAEDRWTMFPYDLATGRLGEALLTDPVYDVIQSGGVVPSIAGVDVTRPVFSAAQQKLVGIWYVKEAPRVKWFDREFIAFQAAVDKALPDTMNVLAGQSHDDQQLLVFAFSDRHPGAYYLFDKAKRSFRPVGERMPWLKPAQMSPTLAIKYEARDGETIHGYLTVPVGHEPRHLPLVVLPHGGPWARDVWGFDLIVQLIASRGYGVLQMNYRGSSGYGSAFGLKGKREVGRAIQHDIEDATRWAIRTGAADPQRIAIAGGSYGGYSAFFALGKSPDLYRCGISLNGVTDWLEIFKSREGEEYRFSRRHWIEQIGDPTEDEEALKAISPVAFAADITAPVLIIQGREDRTVPPRQARSMVAALEKAGRKPETLYLANEGHGLANEKTRREAFEKIVVFLEQHLGPGLPLRSEAGAK